MGKLKLKSVPKIQPLAALRLDLGCGANKKEGFIGVDLSPSVNPDVLHDLRSTPYPFESDSIEEIHCSHFMEHLDGDEQMAFMNELYRILKLGAKATIIIPYWNSARAWQDPTHKRPVPEAAFLYYNRQWREQNGLLHYPINANFDFIIAYNISNVRWVNAHEEARQFAMGHYANVIDDTICTITKI